MAGLESRIHGGGSGASVYVVHFTEAEMLGIIRRNLEAAGLNLSRVTPDYTAHGLSAQQLRLACPEEDWVWWWLGFKCCCDFSESDISDDEIIERMTSRAVPRVPLSFYDSERDVAVALLRFEQVTRFVRPDLALAEFRQQSPDTTFGVFTTMFAAYRTSYHDGYYGGEFREDVDEAIAAARTRLEADLMRQINAFIELLQE
jgi:hypothetical protein